LKGCNTLPLHATRAHKCESKKLYDINVPKCDEATDIPPYTDAH